MYTKLNTSKEDTSIAVANRSIQKKANSKPKFSFVDNRSEASTQRKVLYGNHQGIIQTKGINFDAGTGNMWHVHKNHVKFNGDNSSRIDFSGRTKTSIKKRMKLYHNTLGHDKNTHHTYIQCRKWIDKHL